MPRFTLEQVLDLARGAKPPPGPKVAIAGMQKNPPCFLDWMYFHLSVGVNAFLLRMEDPDPTLANQLDQLQKALGSRFTVFDARTSTGAGGLHDVMDRAKNFINTEAAPRARQLGIDYMLWIDADEFIFPVAHPTVQPVFAQVPSWRRRGWHPDFLREFPDFPPVHPDQLAYVHFTNYEARFPHLECEGAPFTNSGTRFQTDSSKFSLYREGKPAGFIGNPYSQAFCPHAFVGGDCAPSPVDQAVVLHFDSPGFTPWLKKWSHHANAQVIGPGDLYCWNKFPYYAESLNVLKRGGSREEQRQVYAKYRCLPEDEESRRTLVKLDVVGKMRQGQSAMGFKDALDNLLEDDETEDASGEDSELVESDDEPMLLHPRSWWCY
mmetsp:Transcript_25753/g.60130  ORF Transcript_25753/g.60130 Transcript_25753/m.60130 type:complete len:379 (+) Transcript_25753:84-1220(+)